MSSPIFTNPVPAFDVFARAQTWLRRKVGRWVIRRANGKRNGAYWQDAAALYSHALVLLPDRQDVAIQAGNCFKEAGRYQRAVALYDRVFDPRHRAEALLQKGDALARGGAAAEAVEALEGAVALGHQRAEARLEEVSQFGLVGLGSAVSPALRLDQPLNRRFLLNRLTRGGRRDRRWLGTLDRSTHERAGGPGMFWRDHVAFVQVGWLRLKNKGRTEPLLTGVIAVRARIVSTKPVTGVRLALNSRVIAQTSPTFVEEASGKTLYSVNIWIDTLGLAEGRKALTLVADDVDGGAQSIRTVVNIIRTPRELDLTESDGFVPSGATPIPGDAGSVVADRPAQARAAARGLIARPIRHILMMRVDQLGDLSASLAAMQRLKSRFPDARLTALVGPGLVDVVRASDICDEVLGLFLAYDHSSERRYLETTEEARVREVLKNRRFDVAIDLCPGDETRPLLKLVDADHLVGFNPRDFDYLDFGIDVVSRDKVNRIAKLPHAGSVMMLVECLEEALNLQRPPTPRLRDDSQSLADLQLSRKGYVVVHTGARHALNRWPMDKYLALVDRLTRDAGARVVLFTDAPLTPDEMKARAGDVVFLQQTSPDLFDALISNAAVMVGNDSGPKHLAAARGTETVSIHVNRLNWSEWGQDSRGVIITKPAPCSGCGLNDISMCAKDVLCLTSISVDDVYASVSRLWREARDASTASSLPVQGS